MRATFLAAAMIICSHDALARIAGGDQAKALSKGAIVATTAALCNIHLNLAVLGRYFDAHLGEASLEGQDLATAMYLALGADVALIYNGVGSMSDDERRAWCLRQLDDFGPNGRIMPGALFP